MAFPSTPLPLVAQWWIDGAWTDLEDAAGDSAVFGGDRSQGVLVTQGRVDQTRDADPARASFDVDNTGGRFTPANPSGPFYGKFGRNTPIRFGVTADDTWLQFTGPDHGSVGDTPAGGARVTAPDSAALSITGDLDVRIDADLDTWHLPSALGVDLLAKWTSTAGQKSWALVLLPDGDVGLYWSNDGTAENGLTATSPFPVACGRLAIRATIDVNNGAGGHVVTFYTSDSISGSWTQLGDAVTGSGTTSIFDSTTVVTIGDTATGSQASVIRGRWYAAQILDGIGGTVVANPDFTAQTAGASSFADTAAAPNTWTLTGSVELTDFDARFYGTVPDWSPTLDRSGNDASMAVTAAGELARLAASDPPLDSPMKRGILALDTVVAYWPCEDGGDSSNFASGLSNGRPMVWGTTEPSLAVNEIFVCSAPLPNLSGSIWYGPITAHTDTGDLCLQLLFRAPSGAADNTPIASLWTRGSRWDIVYRTVSGGSIQLAWFDSDGTAISTSAAITFAVDDVPLWFQLDLATNGADIDWEMKTLEVGAASGLSSTGTAAGVTTGTAAQVRINRTGGLTSDFFCVGHVVVRTELANLFDLDDQLAGFVGETAGDRIARLLLEQGVQFTGYGDMSDTTRMGVQGRASLLTLLREAAAADVGILFEPPDRTGLAYRARTSIYGQPARLTLDYTASEPSDYRPVTDTTTVVNDVRVTREGQGSPVDTGSSARAVDETTALSVQAPPDGVGPIATDLNLNVETDAELADHASWRLHIGTVDAPRAEALGVQLSRSPFAAADRARVRAVRVGDLVEVTNPPAELGAPDDARFIVQGWSERLHNFAHDVTFTGAPAGPYDVARFDDDTGAWGGSRYSSDGTTIGTPLAAYQAAFAGNSTRTRPDAATGGVDLDVKVKVSCTDWTPAGESIFAAKYNNTGNQRSWAFGITSGGNPIIYWSTDGASNTSVTGSASYGFTNGTTHWVRVTLDVSNGSSVREVRFYASEDGVTWTQVGTTSTGGAATSIFDSTALYQLGARSGTALTSPLTGTIYGVHVASSIAAGVGSDTNLVPFDPNDWTSGYTGTGTGSTVTAQTSSTIALVTPTGPVWTHDDGDFDMILGGERCTLTALSGTSSPQLATLTRSVNGVVKAHEADADIGLFRPVYWGL